MTRAARRRLLVAAAGLLVLGVAGGVLYAVQSPERIAAPAHVAACESPMTQMPRTVGGRSAGEVRVAEAIANISGVALAEDVTGPYDVIARVEANTVDELGKLVIAKIQDVPGITRTLTCTVVHV